MKNYKKIIILLFIFMSVFIPIKANAEVINCSSLRELVDSYNEVEDKLSAIDCNDLTNGDTVSKCNSYNTEKSLILSRIYRYNDELEDCNNSDVERIIKETNGLCTNVFGSTLKDFTKYAMSIFYVLAPFLLIIFGSLDFSRILVMADPDTIKKSKSNFKKRIIAFILIYLTPAIVSFLLSFNTTDYSLDGNVYTCKSEVRFKVLKQNVTYYSRGAIRRGGSRSSLIMDGAVAVHKKYEQEQWTYSLYDLYYNDIKNSSNHPRRYTCCATFIGDVFYTAGVFTEEEVNSYGYNSAPGTARFLESQGWIRINNYADLEAGDIVFMEYDEPGEVGHTQIYAGNGGWYNAGSTNAIQTSDVPQVYDAEYKFLFAYRAP